MTNKLYGVGRVFLLAILCGCADVGVVRRDKSENSSLTPAPATEPSRLCVIDLIDGSECWFGLSEGRLSAGAYTPDSWIFACTNLAAVVSATPRLLSSVGQKSDVVVCYHGTAPEIAASHFKGEAFELCFKELRSGLEAQGVSAKRAEGSFHFTRYPVVRPPKNH